MTDSLPPEGKHPDVIDAEAWLDQLTSLNPSPLVKRHAEVLLHELELLRDRVTNRDAMNDTLRRDLMEAISHHQADIAHISDKARAAAERYDWCEVYDELIDEINDGEDGALHVKLETRRATYEVYFPTTVWMKTEVIATDEDHAITQARLIAENTNWKVLLTGHPRSQPGQDVPTVSLVAPDEKPGLDLDEMEAERKH